MKKNLKNIIVVIILIGLVVGFYFYVSNRKTVDDVEEAVTLSKVEQLLLKEIKNDYPPTPKEVVKYYADLQVVLYSESYTDEQFAKLSERMRELFDDELLENNPEPLFSQNLLADINAYKSNGMSITSYATAASTDVDFFKKDGFEFARLRVSFSVKTGKNLSLVKENFLLRRDGDGHYKIYGWVKAPKDEEE